MVFAVLMQMHVVVPVQLGRYQVSQRLGPSGVDSSDLLQQKAATIRGQRGNS